MTTSDLAVVVGAVSSAAVALFTGWLAWSTRGLANETKRLAKETSDLSRETVAASLAAERHHQDEMRPLVLLDAALTVCNARSRDSGYDYEFVLEGEICNFGGGAATHILLVLTPEEQMPREFRLSVLGPNSRSKIKKSWKAWSGTYHDEDAPWPFRAALGYSTAAFTNNAGSTTQVSKSGFASHLELIAMKPTEFD